MGKVKEIDKRLPRKPSGGRGFRNGARGMSGYNGSGNDARRIVARRKPTMDTVADNKALTGTWKDGQVLLDEPADWPEGCRVVVTPGESPEEVRWHDRRGAVQRP